MANLRERIRRKRERLFHKQRGLCYYCNEPMLLAKGRADARHTDRQVTLEHIIPKSKGGTFRDGNLAAACFACNRDREDKDARLFMLERMGLI